DPTPGEPGRDHDREQVEERDGDLRPGRIVREKDGERAGRAEDHDQGPAERVAWRPVERLATRGRQGDAQRQNRTPGSEAWGSAAGQMRGRCVAAGGSFVGPRPRGTPVGNSCGGRRRAPITAGRTCRSFIGPRFEEIVPWTPSCSGSAR